MKRLSEALNKKDFDRLKQLLLHQESEIPKAVSLVMGDKAFVETLHKVKIAVLSSYTVRNIDSVLKCRLIAGAYYPEIAYGEYNQYTQELLDSKSLAYSMKPDIVIITLDTRTFFDNIEFSMLDMDKAQIDGLLEEKLSILEAMLKKYLGANKANIVITNLEVPSYSPQGVRDSAESGYRDLIRRFNSGIDAIGRKNPSIHVLDFESYASRIGKNRLTDNKFFTLGKFYISSFAIPSFCEEIIELVDGIFGKARKCLVFDLDNTLWGGVTGEDGPTGIKLGGDGIGSTYSEMQKIALNYKKIGIVLAVNSKNNKEDVDAVFEKNPNMVLKREDFTIIKTNWQDKASNLIEISKELNVGLDSIVFIDDNPMERGLVKEALPMVLVPSFPNDVSDAPDMLRSLKCFPILRLTDEDKKRNEMYMQEKHREESRTNLGNLNDYLKDLKIKIEIAKDSIADIDRITQLINKTNQFNLVTNRYTKEQVLSFMESDKAIVFSMRVYDRYGDFGLTGVIILISEQDSYVINDFLMSCRIMGREIEKEFLRQVLNGLDKKTVRATYKKTSKNAPVESFYEGVGFTTVKQTDDMKTYQSSERISRVEWIEVQKNE